MSRILIVDDDPQIRQMLRIGIGGAGFDVVEAADGAEGLKLAVDAAPDLVVLDIGLPEMDGREVCRRLRRTSQVPVLFLTAEGDEIDRVVGLELGADDYVTKPFSPRELVARCRAILKRAAPVLPDEPPGLRHGVLVLDKGRHEARVGPTTVPLTAREMDILERLIARPAQVIPRPALVDMIYGTNVQVSDRTVDSHLRNLRAKLAAAGCPDAIDTVHGVGVRMGPCRGA